MRIYSIRTYTENCEFTRQLELPKKEHILFSELQFKLAGDGIVDGDYFFNYILQQNPERYKDINLRSIRVKNKILRLDFENTTYSGIYVVSEKFKNFCEREKIGFKFYPILSEGKRRYFISLYDLKNELTLHHTVRLGKEHKRIMPSGVNDTTDIFRSDVLEYYGYQMFSIRLGSMYVTENLKNKLDKEGFLFDYYEVPVLIVPDSQDKERQKRRIKRDIEEIEKTIKPILTKENIEFTEKVAKLCLEEMERMKKNKFLGIF